MKRGFLFSVMTLLLLSSLFSLTGYYLTRSKSMQEIKTSVIAGKLKYIENDISKSYFDILGIQFNEIKGSTVKFNQMYTVPNTEDYNAKLLGYETFLENTYSNLMNTDITATELIPEFRIMPADSYFTIGNYLYMYTTDTASLNDIFVQITLSQSGSYTSGAPAGDLTGPTVHVIIKLANGAVALDETKQLAINEANPSFYVDLAELGRVDVYFGLISQPGTLQISPDLVSATVERMEIGYNTAEKVYITVGSIILNPNIQDITKSSTIMLAEG